MGSTLSRFLTLSRIVPSAIRALCPFLLFIALLWWLFVFTALMIRTYGQECGHYRQSFIFLVIPYLALFPYALICAVLEYGMRFWDRATWAGCFVYAVVLYDVFVACGWWVLAAMLQSRVGGYGYFGEEPETSWAMVFWASGAFYSVTAVVLCLFRRILK